MKFLLTNDDGIHAAGLAALAQAVGQLPGAEVTIVAPETEQSQCGHRLTTHTDLTVTQLDAGRYQVNGSPADCVRVALFGLGLKPDWVLSGINAGGNMGQDLPVSGTAAAAREASYHGVPAVAVSHYLVAGRTLDWNRASAWTAQLLPTIFGQARSKDGFWNVNLPHPPEGVVEFPECVQTFPCRAPLPVVFKVTALDEERQAMRYAARYSDRPAEPGSDVAVCFGGKISLCHILLSHWDDIAPAV